MMTETYTETGPFDKPDKLVKRDLLVEEHDENTRLNNVIKKQAIGNVAIGAVAICAMLLVGYKYTQEDVRYMMFERTADNQEIVWNIEGDFAPAAAAVHDAAQSLIWNMRRTAKTDGDLYINLDMRARALERVNAPNAIKNEWLAAEEKNLEKNRHIAVTISKMRSKEVVAPGKMVTVEWTETIYNTKSGSSTKLELTTDLIPTVHKPSNDNPSGVLFNLPTICIMEGECL